MSDADKSPPAAAAAAPKEGGSGDESTDDAWVSRVIGVSGFLGGFSLASVVVISDGPEHFRWPGAAVLVLTVASVLLLGAARQAGRRDAGYDRGFKGVWRLQIWPLYHAGIVVLLVGLGAALPPLPGPGSQLGLRWAAMWVAFAAAAVELGASFGPEVVKPLLVRRKG